MFVEAVYRSLRRQVRTASLAARAASLAGVPASPRSARRRAGRRHACAAGAAARPGARRPGALRRRPARAGAPIDLTGYWVSVVTEDWRWRMVTPPKGDYASIPSTRRRKRSPTAGTRRQGRRRANACKAYGAPGLMRLPGRLRITWQDDTTLKVETDAGIADAPLPLRRLEVAGRRADAAGRHGGRRGRLARAARGADQPPPKFGNLQDRDDAAAARATCGKNGVPYSDKTTLTEYWDLLQAAQRRPVARHHDDRGGPDLPRAHLDHEPQLQEGAERLQVGSRRHARPRVNRMTTRSSNAPSARIGVLAWRLSLASPLPALAQGQVQAAQAALQGQHDRLLRHLGQPPPRGLGGARARARTSATTPGCQSTTRRAPSPTPTRCRCRTCPSGSASSTPRSTS